MGDVAKLFGAPRDLLFVESILFKERFDAPHLFVVLYEEPTLRRTFGDEYEAYFRRSATEERFGFIRVHSWLKDDDTDQ